jgi:type I restriction enzyme S subunit
MMTSDWKSLKLSEITSKIGSGATPRGGKNSYKASGISLVRSLNVYDFKFKTKDLAYIDEEQAKKLSNVTLEENDILLNITGASVARCTIIPDNILPARVNQHVSIIRIKKNIADPYFVLYSINSDYYKHRLLSLAQGGATREALTKEMIEKFEIKLPPLPTQQKIASILSTYDDLIENNNRRIIILEEMARKLYREWFVKFRFPGHEDIKMVDSELGEIPEGWKVVSLEDVCTRITDGSHKSPKSVDVGVPMASVKDMHDFGLNLDSCRQISQEDFEELARNNSKVVANDILVAKDGSYLKHTFVVEKDLDVALLSSIAILTPSQVIKPHLLAYCLRSKVVKERMKQCVSGVAIPRIILKDFRKFKIILPPNEMQVKWSLLVEQTVKMCWNLTSKNYNLKRQRDLLLPKLISGKINV